MGDAVMGMLKQGTKAIYANGRFVSIVDGAAVFAFENQPTLNHAERRRPEVEEALAEHFGRRVPLRLAVEADVAHLGGTTATPPARAAGGTIDEDVVDKADDEMVDPTELTDAGDVPTGGLAKLTEAFPGAVVIEEAP